MSNLRVGLQITLVGVAVVFATFGLLVFFMQWTRSTLSGTGFALRRKLAMPGPVPPHLMPDDQDEPREDDEAEGPALLQAQAGPGEPAGDPGGEETAKTGDGSIPLPVAAAISAVLGVVMSGTAYQVVALKRVEAAAAAPGTAWALAGRMDIMRSREMLSRRKG